MLQQFLRFKTAPTLKRNRRREKPREYLRLQLDASQNYKEGKSDRDGGFEKGSWFQQDVGTIVNDFLVANFESILDYSFTANVEKSFDDAIALEKKTG